MSNVTLKIRNVTFNHEEVIPFTVNQQITVLEVKRIFLRHMDLDTTHPQRINVLFNAKVLEDEFRIFSGEVQKETIVDAVTKTDQRGLLPLELRLYPLVADGLFKFYVREDEGQRWKPIPGEVFQKGLFGDREFKRLVKGKKKMKALKKYCRNAFVIDCAKMGMKKLSHFKIDIEVSNKLLCGSSGSWEWDTLGCRCCHLADFYRQELESYSLTYFTARKGVLKEFEKGKEYHEFTLEKNLDLKEHTELEIPTVSDECDGTMWSFSFRVNVQEDGYFILRSHCRSVRINVKF